MSQQNQYYNAFRELGFYTEAFVHAARQLSADRGLIGDLFRPSRGEDSCSLSDRERGVKESYIKLEKRWQKLYSLWQAQPAIQELCSQCSELEQRLRAVEESKDKLVVELSESKRKKGASYVVGETNHSHIRRNYEIFLTQTLHRTASNLHKALSEGSPGSDRAISIDKSEKAAIKSLLCEAILFPHYRDQAQERVSQEINGLMRGFSGQVRDHIVKSFGPTDRSEISDDSLPSGWREYLNRQQDTIEDSHGDDSKQRESNGSEEEQEANTDTVSDSIDSARASEVLLALCDFYDLTKERKQEVVEETEAGVLAFSKAACEIAQSMVLADPPGVLEWPAREVTLDTEKVEIETGFQLDDEILDPPSPSDDSDQSNAEPADSASESEIEEEPSHEVVVDLTLSPSYVVENEVLSKAKVIPRVVESRSIDTST